MMTSNRDSLMGQRNALGEHIDTLNAAIAAALDAGPHPPSWRYVREKAVRVARLAYGIANDADAIIASGRLD